MSLFRCVCSDVSWFKGWLEKEAAGRVQDLVTPSPRDHLRCQERCSRCALALPSTCTTNPASTISLFAEPIPTQLLPKSWPEIKLWLQSRPAFDNHRAQQWLGSQRSGSEWPSRRPWAGKGQGGKCWLQACTWVLPRQLITCPVFYVCLTPSSCLSKGKVKNIILNSTRQILGNSGSTYPGNS